MELLLPFSCGGPVSYISHVAYIRLSRDKLASYTGLTKHLESSSGESNYIGVVSNKEYLSILR